MHADEIACAKSVPIERIADERKIRLRGRIERVGPCPICGGTDRFAINIKKQLWNCRGCQTGGDVIALVQHLDGVDFRTAVQTLLGQAPTTACLRPAQFRIKETWKPKSTSANSIVRPDGCGKPTVDFGYTG